MTDPISSNSWGWMYSLCCPGMIIETPRRAIESANDVAAHAIKGPTDQEDDFSGPYPLSSNRVMVVDKSSQLNVVNAKINAPSTPPRNLQPQGKNIPAESPLKSNAIVSNRGTGKRRQGKKIKF